MIREALGWLMTGAILALGPMPAVAAENNTSEDKKIVEGPAKVIYGSMSVVLAEGAKAEIRYQPDAKRVIVRTLVKDARVIIPAYLLIFLENAEGAMQVKLPAGRLINVEPGRTEIVGRAITDDPGQIVVRLGGLGPIAQAEGMPPGPSGSQGSVSDMTGDIAAAVQGVIQGVGVEPHGPIVKPQTTPLSNSSLRGFGN